MYAYAQIFFHIGGIFCKRFFFFLFFYPGATDYVATIVHTSC